MSAQMQEKPVLYVDVDGVISLWGYAHDAGWTAVHCVVDGIPHALSSEAGAHLQDLATCFELVWCTGWRDRADDHLPHRIGAPRGLHHLPLEAGSGPASKRAAIDAHAQGRALAWIDDAISAACRAWAAARPAPTLLVRTDPAEGLTGAIVAQLLAWGESHGGGRS